MTRASWVAVAASLACVAQAADDAVTVARRLKPGVQWDAASVVRADVTCDGKPDEIVLGREKSTLWVAVVSGDKSQRTTRDFMQFAIGAGTQAAICSLPARIEASPTQCETENGPLEGCTPSPTCHEFSVVDDRCDSLHFYWHHGRQRIVWWRR